MTDQREKTVFIKSYGCQMNVYDSSRMSDLLAAEGYRETDGPEGADLVILNTCHIREKAAEKVYSELGRLRKLKRAGTGAATIAVAGCVAQAEGREIIARAPNVDMVFGPQTFHRLPDYLARAEKGEKVVETEFPTEDKFDALPAATRTRTQARGRTAFITVQEGCDKFCTFCVVPYTRGSEVSRPVEKLVAEARRLADMGVREFTLLGQNVNAYHGPGPDGSEWSLARLLHELSNIPGVDRLRYTTSHPRDMGDDLIEAHRDLETVMPYLHLPVQSGSDRILKAMNRRHDRELYFHIIARLRAARPDIALSSDFIVGFPGETDEDFADTMDLVSRVTFAQAYSFKYSPRPGTPAADSDEQIPEAVKSERLTALQVLLREQQAHFSKSLIGQTLPVLYEKTGREPGQIIGRSPYLQPVIVQGDKDLIGTIERVAITQAGTNSLMADRMGQSTPKQSVTVEANA